MTVILAIVVGACNSSDELPTIPPAPDPVDGTLIRAATGGTVRLGDGVSLTIPAGSLAEDTIIGIAQDRAISGAQGDGFTPLGTAFRFSPPGTQFDLGKPAILRMAFDPAQLAAQQLDGRTLELAYFDESLGRYFSIGGDIDWATETITARVEHFTLYLPMAAALAIGNNPPTVALQATVPAAIRAGAPIYVRATIRDYDVGGAVAGAQLEYRQAGTTSFTGVAMHPETTLDTFAALIPVGAFTQGTGNDLEYRVTARDNLGASASSAIVAVDVVRTYAPGSLNLTPGTQAIAAGFDKLFAVKANDDLAVAFALVPETASATRGLVATSTVGVNFSARTVGTGQVQARVGADVASATVNVSDGALASVSILDQFGQPIVGTLVVPEGTRYQFDALGRDAWGNQVLVTPTWTADSTVPYVGQDGLVDTLDGWMAGAVRATVGDVTGTQWFQVNARVASTSGTFANTLGYGAHLTTRGSTPYFAYGAYDGSTFSVHVAHLTGATWVDDGVPSTGLAQLSAIAIGAGTSRLEVAWSDGTNMYAAHLEGTTWTRDGDLLNVDPLNDGYLGLTEQLAITFSGDTPWIAFHEYAGGVLSVHVRHWTGAQWVLDGGQVQAAGYNGSDPSIAFLGTVPYVAFAEYASGPSQVLVKRWDGTSWQPVGGSLNYWPLNGQSPTIAMCGNTPIVLFRNYQNYTSPYLGLYARQWDGTTWQLMYGLSSGSYDYVRNASSLACDGNVPYATWIEAQLGPGGNVRRRVSHWNSHTSVWGNIATWNVGGPTDDVSITIAGTTPYAYSQGSVFTFH